jgi:hypothetical protein
LSCLDGEAGRVVAPARLPTNRGAACVCLLVAVVALLLLSCSLT